MEPACFLAKQYRHLGAARLIFHVLGQRPDDGIVFGSGGDIVEGAFHNRERGNHQ